MQQVALLDLLVYLPYYLPYRNYLFIFHNMSQSEWPNSMDVGIMIGNQSLAQILKNILEQLNSLRQTGQETPISADAVDNNALNGFVRRRSSILRAEEALKLSIDERVAILIERIDEKDRYDKTVFEKVYERLNSIEGDIKSNTLAHNELKDKFIHLQEGLDSRFESILDLHNGLKTNFEYLEFQTTRNKKELAADMETKFELMKHEIQALHLLINQIKEVELTKDLKKDEDQIEAIAELQRKMNHILEYQQNNNERLNKINKDMTQTTYEAECTKKDLHNVLHGDFSDLSKLLEKLQLDKADLADLTNLADKSMVDTKADLTELQRLTDEMTAMKKQLTATISSVDSKLNKKFTKLSDFTTRYIRQVPQRESNDHENDELLRAGAGKLKCLVCDQKIDMIEPGSPHQREGFYNTVGMLRYRDVHDDRGLREGLDTQLGKAEDEQRLSNQNKQDMQELEQAHVIMPDIKQGRPKSAPMVRRNKSNKNTMFVKQEKIIVDKF